jgi:hypothetical protein
MNWKGLWNSPGWLVCSLIACWLILTLKPGIVFSAVWGIAFGGLGVTIDRWLDQRRKRVK